MTGGVVVRHQKIAYDRGGWSLDKPVFSVKKIFGAYGARGCTLYPYGVLGHFWGFPDTNAVHLSQKLAKTEPIWWRNPKKISPLAKFVSGYTWENIAYDRGWFGEISPMTRGVVVGPARSLD